MCNRFNCACVKQKAWLESNMNTAWQCRRLGQSYLKEHFSSPVRNEVVSESTLLSHTPVTSSWPYQWETVYCLWSSALTPGMAHSPQSLLLIATNCKMFLPVTGWATLLPLSSLFHLQQMTNKNMFCCFLTQEPGRRARYPAAECLRRGTKTGERTVTGADQRIPSDKAAPKGKTLSFLRLCEQYFPQPKGHKLPRSHISVAMVTATAPLRATSSTSSQPQCSPSRSCA